MSLPLLYVGRKARALQLAAFIWQPRGISATQEAVLIRSEKTFNKFPSIIAGV